MCVCVHMRHFVLCYGHFYFDVIDAALILFKPFAVCGHGATVSAFPQEVIRSGGELFCFTPDS